MAANSITFGSFNNIAKISDNTLDAWAKILKTIPDSRLVLKHFALSEERTCDRIKAVFPARAISSNRLDLRAPTEQAAHLRAYHDIDIALDPFPWSGCVTTCGALWMGVPVLTLPGVAFCHRHSASFLTTVGLTDWIAGDVDDYVAKVIDFASRCDELAGLRLSLRDRVKNSPLCDAPRFTRDFENMLSHMWQETG